MGPKALAASREQPTLSAVVASGPPLAPPRPSGPLVFEQVYEAEFDFGMDLLVAALEQRARARRPTATSADRRTRKPR